MMHVKQSLTQQIFNIAIPTTIENVLQTMVGFVDTLMVAQIGLVAVTGVNLANTVLNVYLAVFLGIGIGTSSLVARKFGAGDIAGAQAVGQQAILLSTGLSSVVGILTIVFGRPLLSMIGATPATLSYAQPFLSWVGGLAIFMAGTTVLGSLLRAVGDAKTPMFTSLMANVINIMLDLILVRGFGPIPALGVYGIIIGTLAARVFSVGYLLLAVQQSRTAVKWRWSWRNRPILAEIVQISLPAAGEKLVLRGGQVVYFSLIVAIGATTFAAHMIAGNIESFVYMPAYGLATAAAVLIGQNVGAKNKKIVQRIAELTVGYGILLLSLLGLVMFLTVPVMATWFTQDHVAIAQIVTALRIDAFSQPGLAVTIIIAGALQGMGDTKTPLWSTLIGMFGIRIIGVIVLGQWCDWGIAGIWIALGIDYDVRAIYLWLTWQKNSRNMV
ncbi:MATE family efflux transporter [Leuconostoc holzapfelii]|uniref:Probable multidrug resistance protein NorM n=1 Tax=Leuconostoc holzapfelii TaxID=434464 RepID=A0A846ZBE0_9LACO|nr:MATE family efflux transporter [Leuconostoc holzapfelii]NKZ18746.1 MATE family efflux transporter [Leuconostoc holzapfelii]